MKLRWIGLGLAISLLGSAPAIAHDQLVDSSPAQGEIVEAGELQIALSFAEDLLEIGTGAQIVVSGPQEGQLQNNGCSQISGTQAFTKVALDEPGEYLVGWRVVSGDGHPISGSYSFTLINTSGFIADPAFSELDCENPITDIAQIETDQSPDPIYWLLFLSIGLVAAGLFFFLRPKNSSRGNGPKGQD